jgi:hypothetical protein
MFTAIGIFVATFFAGVVYASFAEWVIHKYMMHRPIFGYRHFYVAHAQVHHGKYQANPSYWLGERPPYSTRPTCWPSASG